jgi:hypothetical protein
MTHRISYTCSTALLTLAVLTGCTGSGREAGLHLATTDTLAGGGVRTISTGATEWTDTTGWRLVLERELLTDASISEEMGQIVFAAAAPNGDVLVREWRPAVIRKFPADGSRPTIFTRDGDGPAEFRQPNFAIHGDTVVVFDSQQWRLALLDRRTGAELSSTLFRTSLGGGIFQVDTSGIITVEAAVPYSEGGRLGESYWVKARLDGTRIDSLQPPIDHLAREWNAEYIIAKVPFAPQPFYRFLMDGTLIYGTTDRDEFVVSRTGTDTIRIFGRTGASPLPLAAATADSVFAKEMERPEFQGIAKRSDIPDHLPLWLSMPDTDSTSRYDVYDRAGRYRGEVAAPWGKARTWWGPDRVAVYREDGDGNPMLSLYRVSRIGR